jgi:hypothetical protein
VESTATPSISRARERSRSSGVSLAENMTLRARMRGVQCLNRPIQN